MPIENERQYMTAAKLASRFRRSIADVDRRAVVTALAKTEREACEWQLADLLADMAEYEARVNGDRKGDWMPVFTGGRFWPQDPRPDDVRVEDIAHALARINRFNGHTRVSYSVAQHSVMVMDLLPDELKLFGLLHDASECYLGDVITPVKRLIRPFYEPLEEAVMLAVADAYGFTMGEREKAEVKVADMRLLATEVRDLTTAGFINGELTEPPLPYKIEQCWKPTKAERLFLVAFARAFDTHRTLRRNSCKTNVPRPDRTALSTAAAG